VPHPQAWCGGRDGGFGVEARADVGVHPDRVVGLVVDAGPVGPRRREQGVHPVFADRGDKALDGGQRWPEAEDAEKRGDGGGGGSGHRVPSGQALRVICGGR